MAEADDILLKLKTEGDTSGAEAVEKSIFAVEDAAKDASRQADVDIAKGKQAAAVQREVAAATRDTADAAQRLVAAKLADHVGDIAQQFGAVGPEAELATNAVSSFGKTLATTGNIFAAIAAVAGSAAGSVVTAWTDAREKIKRINKEQEEEQKRQAELRTLFVAQIRAENLAAFYERERDAIRGQVTELENLRRVQQSEDNLASGRADRSGATGSDQGLLAIRQQVQANETARKIADQALQDALLAISAAQSTGDAAAVRVAEAARDQARDAIQTLVKTQALDLTNQIEQTTAQGAEELQAKNTDVAQKLAAQFDKLKDAGGENSTFFKQANALVEDILADQKVSESENAKLAQLVELFRQSGEASTQANQQLANESLGAMRANTAALTNAAAQMAALKAENERLAARFGELQQQISTFPQQ